MLTRLIEMAIMLATHVTAVLIFVILTRSFSHATHYFSVSVRTILSETKSQFSLFHFQMDVDNDLIGDPCDTNKDRYGQFAGPL